MITAHSFGFLTSKRSATRGSPPVMSLVFVVSLGIFAMMSPAVTMLPSGTERIAFNGRIYRASLFVPGILMVLPLSFLIDIRGRISASLYSTIVILTLPVTGSTFSVMVRPAMMSPNLILPETSVRMGVVYVSHTAIRLPGSIGSPSFLRKCAP